MRPLGLFAATAAACALALASSGASANATGETGARPALWRTYDLILNLQNLPRTYTCDQLWYEVHGILERLGAWPYSINILPYNCSPSPSGAMKSPDVQVRFQLPFFLQGVGIKSAPAEAIERTLQLSPGEPKTLHPSDCQLMQQITRTLLASIPVRIDEQHFDCSESGPRAGHFKVVLTLPMGVKLPVARPTSAAGPH
ncbi:MAG TPA: hypothetical protein VJ738_15900 [Steroidobacteraceae bacterium]|nr:hypothetical protein [Steroidobacteraceae bacterium]